jgi:hypothetical protein
MTSVGLEDKRTQRAPSLRACLQYPRVDGDADAWQVPDAAARISTIGSLWTISASGEEE